MAFLIDLNFKFQLSYSLVLRVQQVFCMSFYNFLYGLCFLPWSSVGEEARRTWSRHCACAHTWFGADSVLTRKGAPLSTET